MKALRIISLVALVSVTAVLAATALAGPQKSQRSTTTEAGYTPAAVRAMGARWEAYAARYAGRARHTAARSGYTPAAVRAMGARWEAYAAWARQEDARRDDPRLGLASTEPTAMERLLRQEDARGSDTRLGIATSAPVVGTGEAPTLQVVARDGFDWLDAVIGAMAGFAAVVALAGATVAARSVVLRRA
jgi:hypothetical protein